MGGVIKAAFSCLVESCEPTSSVRMHSYTGEKRQFPGLGITATFHSIPLVIEGGKLVPAITA